MIARRVMDVIRHAEDCDFIRVRKMCGRTSHVVARGEWYSDDILEVGDKRVISWEYDNSGERAIWNILIA